MSYKASTAVLLPLFHRRGKCDTQWRTSLPPSPLQPVASVKSEPGSPMAKLVLLVKFLPLLEPVFKETPQFLQTEIRQSVFDGSPPWTYWDFMLLTWIHLQFWDRGPPLKAGSLMIKARYCEIRCWLLLANIFFALRPEKQSMLRTVSIKYPLRILVQCWGGILTFLSDKDGGWVLICFRFPVVIS